MIRTKDQIKIQVTERMFTVTLTESEVIYLIRRLKFKETFIPDLSEPAWNALEESLGYKIEERN